MVGLQPLTRLIETDFPASVSDANDCHQPFENACARESPHTAFFNNTSVLILKQS